jgi:hypothetical protein
LEEVQRGQGRTNILEGSSWVEVLVIRKDVENGKIHLVVDTLLSSAMSLWFVFKEGELVWGIDVDLPVIAVILEEKGGG